MTHDRVRTALADLHQGLADEGVRTDEPHLRLLDAALWTQAKWR
jgi:hypothetical protein